MQTPESLRCPSETVSARLSHFFVGHWSIIRDFYYSGVGRSTAASRWSWRTSAWRATCSARSGEFTEPRPETVLRSRFKRFSEVNALFLDVWQFSLQHFWVAQTNKSKTFEGTFGNSLKSDANTVWQRSPSLTLFFVRLKKTKTNDAALFLK